MPTQSPQTGLNGHTPHTTLTPAQPTASPPAARANTSDEDGEQAREERVHLIATKGRRMAWGFRAVYLAALIIALTGQATGIVTRLNDIPLWIALMMALALETFDVAFAAWAAYRRQLGENGYLPYFFAVVLSAAGVWINWWGHSETVPVLGGVYALFSALGFATFVFESAGHRRDALWLQRKIDDPGPVYGLWLSLRSPRLVGRANQLFLKNRNLGRSGSLEAARLSLEEEDCRKALIEIFKHDVAQTMSPEDAELYVKVLDADELARMIQNKMRPKMEQVADVYVHRLDPQQLSMAARRAKRRGLGRRPVMPPPVRPAAPAGPTTPATSTPQRVVVRTSAKTEPTAVGRRSTADRVAELAALKAADPDITQVAAAKAMGITTARLREIEKAIREGLV